MKPNTFQHIIVYTIGIWLNLVFIITFWSMLINWNPNLLIKTNIYGEFWIEFFLLNGIFIFQLILTIKLLIKYWREKT